MRRWKWRRGHALSQQAAHRVGELHHWVLAATALVRATRAAAADGRRWSRLCHLADCRRRARGLRCWRVAVEELVESRGLLEPASQVRPTPNPSPAALTSAPQPQPPSLSEAPGSPPGLADLSRRAALRRPRRVGSCSAPLQGPARRAGRGSSRGPAGDGAPRAVGAAPPPCARRRAAPRRGPQPRVRTPPPRRPLPAMETARRRRGTLANGRASGGPPRARRRSERVARGRPRAADAMEPPTSGWRGEASPGPRPGAAPMAREGRLPRAQREARAPPTRGTGREGRGGGGAQHGAPGASAGGAGAPRRGPLRGERPCTHARRLPAWVAAMGARRAALLAAVRSAARARAQGAGAPQGVAACAAPLVAACRAAADLERRPRDRRGSLEARSVARVVPAHGRARRPTAARTACLPPRRLAAALARGRDVARRPRHLRSRAAGSRPSPPAALCLGSSARTRLRERCRRRALRSGGGVLGEARRPPRARSMACGRRLQKVPRAMLPKGERRGGPVRPPRALLPPPRLRPLARSRCPPAAHSARRPRAALAGALSLWPLAPIRRGAAVRSRPGYHRRGCGAARERAERAATVATERSAPTAAGREALGRAARDPGPLEPAPLGA